MELKGDFGEIDRNPLGSVLFSGILRRVLSRG